MLHHLWIESSLETGDSLSIGVNLVGSIATQVVEGMQILRHGFGALIRAIASLQEQLADMSLQRDQAVERGDRAMQRVHTLTQATTIQTA